MASSLDSKALAKLNFEKHVSAAFRKLVKRGFHPNLAAAYAVMLVSTADEPVSSAELHAAAALARAGGDTAPLLRVLRQAFASPEALAATFAAVQAAGPAAARQPANASPHQQQLLAVEHACCGEPSTEAGLPREASGAAACWAPGSPARPGAAGPRSAAAALCYSAVSKPERTGSNACQEGGVSIDFEAVDAVYGAVQECNDWEVTSALLTAVHNLLERLTPSRPLPALAACVLLDMPLLDDPEHSGLLYMICSACKTVDASFGSIQDLFAHYSRERLQALVVRLRQALTILLLEAHDAASRRSVLVQVVVSLLGTAYAANEQSGVLCYTEFYVDAVNSEEFPLQEDFQHWKRGAGFCFCHYPFVFEAASKAALLDIENQGEQFASFREVMMQALVGDEMRESPYLVLRVRRGRHLVHDTMLQVQIAASRRMLKRPLKVAFWGEEGVDEGGVQKEFFQLIFRELFDAAYGMFVLGEGARAFWPRASDIDMSTEFQLVGTMLALAVYNGHTLDVAFPMVLWRKLMGRKVGLADLAEVHPEVHRSLVELLAMPGDIVADLALVFQVEREGAFGEGITADDLMPGGGDVPVTRANRGRFVELYARHLLEGAIARQFSAFRRGFEQLCGGPAMGLLRPEELEQLVCGRMELDFVALQEAARYDSGFTADTPIIAWLWDIVHEVFDDAERRRLLFFLTASDRAPVKGLGALAITVSRNGPDSLRLPTAHTCFNVLLLPDYRCKETLLQRLRLAIDNAEGFGLR